MEANDLLGRGAPDVASRLRNEGRERGVGVAQLESEIRRLRTEALNAKKRKERLAIDCFSLVVLFTIQLEIFFRYALNNQVSSTRRLNVHLINISLLVLNLAVELLGFNGRIVDKFHTYIMVAITIRESDEETNIAK